MMYRCECGKTFTVPCGDIMIAKGIQCECGRCSYKFEIQKWFTDTNGKIYMVSSNDLEDMLQILLEKPLL